MWKDQTDKLDTIQDCIDLIEQSFPDTYDSLMCTEDKLIALRKELVKREILVVLTRLKVDVSTS